MIRQKASDYYQSPEKDYPVRGMDGDLFLALCLLVVLLGLYSWGVVSLTRWLGC